ncbi:acireductone dioxygenase [Aetokthonos hydrillicola Thurmond2011]|jgi:1,2-dihydroxy-3-keto-5-methylthiopentene dioxygenase|uniref:Acireductone dioxygenase n=1 Tax=Aetokthonos hydrillicola Thurmond2011 TaxID=2712845 RepID=A0AAP5M722_9CYAN|nr:cupin domain-containing protein [Aetokthonos hydrillicola]MBO3464023.1 acireductone dioxygenase [Aetokthonos hydrillicola CCALA 1050]MBW4588843.1 acireductone dioxygenase [Aetokthonos hydrillicola CCALA 1050]MDR9897681.1 acireductone dioxygenase [Aetokthonos hydrillicola Thurmond2011]
MAILQLEDGTIQTNLEDIAEELKPLNIQVDRWSIGNDPQLHNLLGQDSLNEDEKEQVLKALDGYFEQLKQKAGYKSRDLIVLHPGVPSLDELMAKFDKIHTHADDEVRYVIDGEGIFGFVRPDGSQIELTVQKEEYINVPAETEHWFYLTKTRRIKAVRYFSNTEGWMPRYRN